MEERVIQNDEAIQLKLKALNHEINVHVENSVQEIFIIVCLFVTGTEQRAPLLRKPLTVRIFY